MVEVVVWNKNSCLMAMFTKMFVNFFVCSRLMAKTLL